MIEQQSCVPFNSHATAGQLRARGQHLQGIRGREYLLKKRCDHMACLKGKDARDGKGRQQQTCEQTGFSLHYTVQGAV